MRLEIWDPSLSVLVYEDDYSLPTSFFTAPQGYLRLFNVSIDDTSVLVKNNYTMKLTWEAFDLTASL
ncbi:MAG: hypothetical protein QF535_03695, partial [Anaerolineales bacterium]|nr:hypothetical protein [Anaerolineales bacterium]